MRFSSLVRGVSVARRRQRNAGRTLRACTLAALAASVACRDVGSLTQANPGALSANGIFVPSNAQLIVNSSQGDFECAYNSYIGVTGLFVDELAAAINFGE